jgi:hypothetical protein
MRIHSNGLLLRTTNKKIVMKLKDGAAREWLFADYPDKRRLVAAVADTGYSLAANHEKGKFNVVNFATTLTRFFVKHDPAFQAEGGPKEGNNYPWLHHVCILPYSKQVAGFSPTQLKDLNDLVRFFYQNPIPQ